MELDKEESLAKGAAAASVLGRKERAPWSTSKLDLQAENCATSCIRQ